MKKFCTYLLFCLILDCVSTATALSMTELDTNKTAINKMKIKGTYLWSSTPFLSAGYGYPQGFRAETGYTLGYFLTLGLSFGIGDTWSKDPGEGTIAWLARLNIPIEKTHAGFYFSILSGTNFSIFGGSDSYTLASIGLIYPLTDFLHLRPEFGIALLSKYISGGSGIFGNSPLINESKTVASFNLIFEFDLRPMLWSSW